MPAEVEGPTILHVGERKHGDKNFETSEVVLAAPGTVVAPIPKGMKVNSENALMLILQQILGSRGQGSGPRALPKAANGTVTSVNDMDSLLAAMNDYAGTSSSYNLGNKAQSLNERKFYADNSLAKQQMYNSQHPVDTDHSYALSQQSLQENRRTSDRNYDLAVKQAQDNSAELALKKLLGMRGLDIEQQTANQQGELGREANRLHGNEINNQFTLGNRQMNLQQAADEFARIMAGVSEASLPGVRAGGTPSFGVYS